MPENASPFVIRQAAAADKDPILAFCEHTFDWGDYLHLAWDDWLADETGRLLVATLDEAPVGVAKVTLATPAEAWLQGLRVHPAHRRQGLAWQLQNQCLNMARELGASVARLATSSQNTPVHKMMERAGMHRVAEVRVLQAAKVLPRDAPIPLVALATADWPVVFRHILDGPALAAAGGLYGDGWMWQELTRDKLRAHLAHGQVLATCGQDGQFSLAIVSEADPDDRLLPVWHVDGEESQMANLALGLRQRAAVLQADKVELVLPAASPLLHVFAQAGYKPEDEGDATFYIYELDLKGTTL